jgi:DNA-directed RNA polymerase specialized sigma24 family protein
MPTGISAEAFARLLAHLDADRARAGERYEDLRRTLLRFFEWRGAPFPDQHADESLDRVARRLAEGVEIKNIGAYCHVVARLVFLETLKGPDSRRAAIEPSDVAAAPALAEEAATREARLVCLDECLRSLPAESSSLIVEYYRDDKRGRVEGRRAQAERLGIKSEALANRAQRLRNKLEQCVKACINRASPT